MTPTPLPRSLEPTRQAALHLLGQIRPVSLEAFVKSKFPLNAIRTKAGRKLPDYYLVYFLLVDLLGFKNLGKFEKVSWSVPIEFNGRAFLIEHRKLGLGVLARDAADEEAAAQIVIHIQEAVRVAQPFFEWLAKQAVQDSSVNVVNRGAALLQRFTYLLDSYRSKSKEAFDRKDERVVEEGGTPDLRWTHVSFPVYRLQAAASWLALAAIEAFFSWTEHIFIQISILSGNLRTASEVTELAEANWHAKFERAIGFADTTMTDLFNKLVVIRRELRNFAAHGAFGKQGEAFRFHSGAGAVPVLLPHLAGSRTFLLGDSSMLSFDDDAALAVIAEFIEHLWRGARALR
jgi:hypothetical protein